MLGLGLLLAKGDYQPGTGLMGWSPVQGAHAVVGRQATPYSMTGVARRTTRRVIVRTSIYVATLPPACTVVVIDGASLHQCGGTYYQPHGNQYVVVNVQ